MPTADDELIPTRATLLQRLRNWQDQSSWQEFFDTYWRLIYGVARKAGMTEVEAQDVVQETMVSVARHMPTFKYNPAIGSFKTWLLNMTRWRIVDQMRKRQPSQPHHASAGGTATGTATIEKVVDPASPDMDNLWNTEWERTLLDAAIDKVRVHLDPQKYQIFDFYVNKGWAPDKVAEAFGIPVGQVYQAKHRVTEMIKDEVKRLEKEMT